MKKGTALLLAAVLALLCAASAHAGAVPWTDTDTSGYREVWYVDYGQTVANDINGSTPMGSSNAGAGETRWVIERCFAAGFEVGSLLGTDSERNVVPVDLTVEENTVYVYAIATRKVVIGLLFAKVNVKDGTLTLEGQVKNGEVYFRGETLLMAYPSVGSLSGAGIICEAGESMSIADELEGAPAVLVELDGFAAYAAIIASDNQGGSEVRHFALQDYWKNESKWKTYRAGMTDALGKVPK